MGKCGDNTWLPYVSPAGYEVKLGRTKAITKDTFLFNSRCLRQDVDSETQDYRNLNDPEPRNARSTCREVSSFLPLELQVSSGQISRKLEVACETRIRRCLGDIITDRRGQREFGAEFLPRPYSLFPWSSPSLRHLPSGLPAVTMK